jgi:hypothetical protein
MRFAWSFEREAKWMLWLLLVPAILILLSILIPLVTRALSS